MLFGSSRTTLYTVKLGLKGVYNFILVLISALKQKIMGIGKKRLNAVWPNFFLMNVFFALKGSKLCHHYLLSLQLDVVPCGGHKKSPRTHL